MCSSILYYSKYLITPLLLHECNHSFFKQIDANTEECFYDRVKTGTKMGLIFEVAEGGALDIDVRIEGKSKNTLLY